MPGDADELDGEPFSDKDDDSADTSNGTPKRMCVIGLKSWTIGCFVTDDDDSFDGESTVLDPLAVDDW